MERLEHRRELGRSDGVAVDRNADRGRRPRDTEEPEPAQQLTERGQR
jgi:hypothetical protein